MEARLRKMLDSLTTLASFRAKYDIPNEISLELVEANDFRMEETEKGMWFPVIAIVEGGLRFSLFAFL